MLKQLCVAISKEFALTKFEGSQAKIIEVLQIIQIRGMQE